MMVYNTELDVVNVYFDHILPAFTSFNMTAYNHDITEKCPYQAEIVSSMEHQERCQTQVSAEYAQTSKLWTPTKDIPRNRHHHLPDCNYSVSFLGAAVETPTAGVDFEYQHLRFTEHAFLVHQNCSSGNLKLAGGATFNIFGYSDEALAACTAQDFLDGKFKIVCKTPDFSGKPSTIQQQPGHDTRGLQQKCLRLTVLLEHEHFDAMSLVIGSWSDLYSGMRQVLVNNETFCSVIQNDDNKEAVHSISHNAHFLRKSSLPPFLSITDQMAVDASIFSGIWTRQNEIVSATADLRFRCWSHFVDALESCADISTEHSNGRCHQSWYRDLKLNVSMQLEMLTTQSNERYISPSWMNNWRGCFLHAYGYKAMQGRLEVFDPDMSMVSGSPDLVQQFSFRPLQMKAASAGVPQYPHLEWSVPHYPNLHRLLSNKTELKFVGASHMRYLFLSMLEVMHGARTVANFPRKVVNCTFQNLDFEGARYANEHVEVLSKTCTTWANRGVTNGVFIVQAGDWDLTVGISRFLRDPSYGASLVKFLKELVEGSLNCSAVSHLVYVTGVPHPVCMSDLGHDYCADMRSFRTNTAIAALNTYVLRHLLAATVHPSMKLSIVDAYSIISPRIMLNENHETVCTNHFSCGVEFNRRDTMAHTPSGMAVNQALLYALTSAD
jgi:hypothetical protein